MSSAALFELPQAKIHTEIRTVLPFLGGGVFKWNYKNLRELT
jgi:hypothetical protein